MTNTRVTTHRLDPSATHACRAHPPRLRLEAYRFISAGRAFLQYKVQPRVVFLAVPPVHRSEHFRREWLSSVHLTRSSLQKLRVDLSFGLQAFWWRWRDQDANTTPVQHPWNR